MSIANLPAFFDMNYSKPDGKLAPDGYLYNDQMFQSLNSVVVILNTIVTTEIMTSGGANQNTVVNKGIKFPPYTTTEITALEPTANNGTVWFNTTLAKLQVKTASGVVQTITSV